MGHGLELYCRSGMRELGDFGVLWGLDKIWRFALGMVQMGVEPGSLLDRVPFQCYQASWGDDARRSE